MDRAEKLRRDALGRELAELCKERDRKGVAPERAESLIYQGADVNFKASKPIYNAVKAYNFALIKKLIDFGALDSATSRAYLAAMCERGGFNEKREQAFFDCIDYAIAKTGFDMAYLTAYINTMLLGGKLNKVLTKLSRYGISVKTAADNVYLRVIFELIEKDLARELKFVEDYREWMDAQALSIAVAGGETKVAAYILFSRADLSPTRESVARAVFKGHIDVLEVLTENGFSLKDELYLKNACKAFPTNPESLEFLFKNGYTFIDEYDGKSIYRNAVEENNLPLVNFLRSLGVRE